MRDRASIIPRPIRAEFFEFDVINLGTRQKHLPLGTRPVVGFDDVHVKLMGRTQARSHRKASIRATGRTCGSELMAALKPPGKLTPIPTGILVLSSETVPIWGHVYSNNLMRRLPA